MFVKRSLELAILLVVYAISTGALARSSDAAVTSSTQSFSEPESMIQGEVRRFGKAQISVRDAIKIAQEHITGAKAVDVSFDSQADRLTYRVRTYQADDVWEGIVDASTGMITEGRVTSVSELNATARSELASFRAAGIDLYDVVLIAEEYGSGKAVSAGLGKKDRRPIFLVVLVADGSLKQVSLDLSRTRSRSRKATHLGKSGR